MDIKFKKNQIKAKIVELQIKLDKTDYMDNKLTQAIKQYILTGDKTPVILTEQEYGENFKQRQAWRDEINLLETELKAFKG